MSTTVTYHLAIKYNNDIYYIECRLGGSILRYGFTKEFNDYVLKFKTYTSF